MSTMDIERQVSNLAYQGLHGIMPYDLWARDNSVARCRGCGERLSDGCLPGCTDRD